MRYDIILDTSDYLALPTNAASVTLTPQRLQIILSLAVIALDRDVWETLSDSAWDAWVAGLTEMIEQLQDY